MSVAHITMTSCYGPRLPDSPHTGPKMWGFDVTVFVICSKLVNQPSIFVGNFETHDARMTCIYSGVYNLSRCLCSSDERSLQICNHIALYISTKIPYRLSFDMSSRSVSKRPNILTQNIKLSGKSKEQATIKCERIYPGTFDMDWLQIL